MTDFRFLHAADIHLDSPLKGLSGHDGGAAERIRTATREAFDQLIGLAIEERVAFLIIAGDLYDGDWRDYRTGLFFTAQMGRLNEAAIPVYLLYGNHDAESQITRRLTLPGNVHIFANRKPETFAIEALGVALHGQGFRERDVTENLVLGYPDPIAGAFNIGVLHTGLGGMGGHENYAPCTLADLVNKGYDYWALGHVHQGQILGQRPHVVFPGNLQGRHIREAGAKGACLVSVHDGEVAEVDTPRLDVVRWALLAVDLEGVGALGEVVDRIRDALEDAVSDSSDGRLLACRVELRGRSDIHERLVASEEDLLAEARSLALGLGEDVAWIEKLVLRTEPGIDPEARAEREDAIGELQRALRDAAADPDLLSRLQSDVGEMVRHLPHEVRAETDDAILAAAIEGDYGELITKVMPYLSARLVAEEG